MEGLQRPEIRAAIRRFRWYIAAASLVGIVAGVAIVDRFPPAYEATTTLAVGPGKDATTPEVVVRRLEYLYDAYLAETAATIAAEKSLLSAAGESMGLPVAGYSATAEVSDPAQVIPIAVTGPSADVALSLADRLGSMTSDRFALAYPDYDIRVIDRRVEEAWSIGTPVYALPTAFALLAALGACAIAMIVHNRPGTHAQAGSGSDGPRLPDEEVVPAGRRGHVGIPVISERWPWLNNLSIGVIVGAVVGLIAAGSGMTMFFAGALAVAAAVAAAVFRPEWALVALITLVTLRLAEIAGDFYGVPQATIPVVAAVVGVLAMRFFVWGERPTGWVPAAIAIGCVATAAMVSVVNAEYPASSFDQIIEFGKSAVVFVLVVVLISSARDFRVAIWSLIALGGLMASLSVFQYLTGSFDQSFFGLAQARYMNIAFDYNDFRITGPFGDPNFYGQALVPIFAIALERAWHESRTMPRVVAAIAASMSLLAIVFTLSRGALLAIVVVGVAAFFTLRPSVRATAIGGLALAALIVLLPADYVTRATALFSTDQSAELSTDPSVNQRTSILASGLLMFADYPVAGVGIGNFPDRYLEYAADVGIEQQRTKIEPHSFYVEIAAETGVVGLLAWGVVGVVGFETVRSARRRLAAAGETDLNQMVTAFAVGLVGFFTAALFLHLAYARYMWVLLAIVFALPKVVASAVDRLDTPSETLTP